MSSWKISKILKYRT